MPYTALSSPPTKAAQNLPTIKNATEGQRRNLLNTLREIFNENTQAPKQGILYTPFANENMLEAATGSNITRLKNGKPLFPLIAKDDAAMDVLENCREIAISFRKEKYQPLYKPSEIDLHLKVLTEMKIFSNANKAQLAKLDPARDKIYILGYGGPGNRYLHPTSCDWREKMSTGYLVEELRVGGLQMNFRDFRLVSCNSADVRKPLSSSPADLRRASTPKSGRRSLLRFGARSEAKVPLAQALSETLSLLQFNDAEVTGYHGEGKVFSNQIYSTQVINEETKRRSRVKSIFKADGFGQVQIINK